MNPFAAEFVPMNQMKPSKNNKNKALDTLRSLSMTVAENVLQPISHRTFELTLTKTFRPIIIPKITNMDELEQVAQISYNHETGVDLWELFWDGTHAILDNRISSWQFPDMPISDIIHYYFDEETSVTISPDCAAPASYAPGIQIVVTPIFPDEAYWSEHRWKIIP
jgi:hypothetical protein